MSRQFTMLTAIARVLSNYSIKPRSSLPLTFISVDRRLQLHNFLGPSLRFFAPSIFCIHRPIRCRLEQPYQAPFHALNDFRCPTTSHASELQMNLQERWNIGGRCAHPECNRYVLLDASYCNTHKAVQEAMDTRISAPVDLKNHRKRLGGSGARFVAKKSENVLRSSSSSHSSISQQSPRSPEITTQSLHGIHPQKAVKCPTSGILVKPCLDGRALIPTQAEVGQKIGPADDQSSLRDVSSSETEDRVLSSENHKDDANDGMDQAESSHDVETLVIRPLATKALETEPRKATPDKDLQQKTRRHSPISIKLNEQLPHIQPPQDDPLVQRFQQGVILKKPYQVSSMRNRPVNGFGEHRLPSTKMASSVTGKIFGCNHSESSNPARPHITKVLPVPSKRKISEISCDLSENSLRGATTSRSTKDVVATHVLSNGKLTATQQPVHLSKQFRLGMKSCNGNHNDVSQVKGPPGPDMIKPQPRQPVKRYRKARQSKFDSAAFDTMIYKQSNLRPPATVRVQPRSPAKATTSSEGKRIAVPVNPAIHGMHNRSEEWYRRKKKEVEKRGGRKAWFGKAVERMHSLRSQKTAEEEVQKQAREKSIIPPRQDPQPWSHRRVLDFGDVEAEDLPDDVKENSSWLSACAWMRQSRQDGIQRHRRVLRTTEETERYYTSVMNGLNQ